MRELAALLANEGLEAAISTPHRNFSVSILLAVPEQEAERAESTHGPNMQYTETSDFYRKADHQYFKDTAFRSKTWSSKCHKFSDILICKSACEKLIWVQILRNREISDTYQSWRVPKCAICMHVPLWVVCIHQEHSDSHFSAQQPLWRSVLCWGHKWWHLLATHPLSTAETENSRGLDGEGRKMHDTECPSNTSNI